MDLFDDFELENNNDNYRNIDKNIEENETKIKAELESKRILKNIWKKPDLDRYIKRDKKERDESIQAFLNQVNDAMKKINSLVIDRFEGNIAVCENRETR